MWTNTTQRLSIKDVLQIYHKIDEDKNDFAVHEHPHKIAQLWDGIKHVKGVSFPLIIGCCMVSMKTHHHHDAYIQILHELEGLINDIDLISKTALIHAYAHTSSLNISVGAIIKCLIKHNLSRQALQIYDEQNALQLTDNVSHLLALKACMDCHDFVKGKTIHATLKQHKIKLHAQLYGRLIEFYGHFGDIDNAQMIFNSVPRAQLNVECIGSLMKCFMDNHRHEQALTVYKQFDALQNDITHLLALKACTQLNDKTLGQLIIDEHALYTHRNKHSIQLRTVLMQFYGHLMNDTDTAMHIFNDMEHKNTIVVNCMLQILVQNHQHKDALSVFKRFERIADDTMYLFAIKACSNMKDIAQCHDIISQHLQVYDDSHSMELLNAVIHFYGMIGGDMEAAQNVYHAMSQAHSRDVSTVNTMMQCYIQNGLYVDALALYTNTAAAGETDLDHISKVLAIKACIHSDDITQGQHIIHSLQGHNLSIEVEHCLVNFYGHFKDIERAQRVFDGIKDKNTVSINCMMQALIANECAADALSVYDEYNTLHDDISHVHAVAGCSMIGNIQKAKHIHSAHADTESIQLRNTLIDCYGKCGAIEHSKTLFDSISDVERTVVTMNCMMSALCENECYEDALRVYDEMDCTQNDVSHLLALKACKHTQQLDKGNQIYEQIERKKTEMGAELRCSFIDFYGSCGDMESALRIFNACAADSYDIALWNAMIHAYGRSGDIVNAKAMYDKVIETADMNTFCIFLNGCSHCGQVNMARFVWDNHITDEQMKENKYVMTAFVDCLARNGYLDDAYQLVSNSKENHQEMWFALLSGCRNHDDKNMASQVYFNIKQRFQNTPIVMRKAKLLVSNMLSKC
eukprot:247985_1